MKQQELDSHVNNKTPMFAVYCTINFCSVDDKITPESTVAGVRKIISALASAHNLGAVLVGVICTVQGFSLLVNLSYISRLLIMLRGKGHTMPTFPPKTRILRLALSLSGSWTFDM